MKKRGLITFLGLYCVFNLFCEIPNGAKEIIHLKVEQENRFFILHVESGNVFKSQSWSDIYMTNGAMLEASYKSFTLSSSLLTDYNIGSGANKIDFDLGYEFGLKKNLRLQPFIGSEVNSYGSGVTFGAKLNQSFDVLDYACLGLFAGLRYSKSNNPSYELPWHGLIYSDYVSASVGVYLTFYTYQRHKINTDW